ncbi:MAG: hypothetical protein HOQ44_02930 [Nocardia sp.]|nr:hypothetical protein [Nocardia sp.]
MAFEHGENCCAVDGPVWCDCVQRQAGDQRGQMRGGDHFQQDDRLALTFLLMRRLRASALRQLTATLRARYPHPTTNRSTPSARFSPASHWTASSSAYPQWIRAYSSTPSAPGYCNPASEHTWTGPDRQLRHIRAKFGEFYGYLFRVTEDCGRKVSYIPGTLES